MPLTSEQKSKLLERAKISARSFHESRDDWTIDDAVDTAIANTADERFTVSGFDGPRNTAKTFLEKNRSKIKRAV